MEKIIDLYFDENYGKLYENVEKGKAEIFEFENEDGKITNQFLIREIPEKIEEKTFYDIVTPYGYGGPIINYLKGNKENLLKEYEKSFAKFAEDKKIVSEFVRFHPIFENALDMKQIYNSTYMRKTLITKLDEEDVVQKQISKSARKNIRQALNKGVTYKITEKPEDISVFKDIYYSTMDRNKATDYYYFDDKYFGDMLKYYRENILLIEAVFEGNLSGTLTEYLYLSPAYILRYALVLWGIENKYKIIHHGGGRSNSEDDSLYLFKKNFAKLYDVDFYIGKKIWNKEIYDKLCKMKNVEDDGFFPAYRKQ